MYAPKLGLRNIFRQKRRTATTLLVMTFGIGCLLMAEGHSRYVEWGLRELTTHTETGHLQIFSEDYFSREEDTVLKHGLENYERIRGELNRIRDVEVVAARISFMGLISNGDKSVAFVGEGIEPEAEQEMRNLFGVGDPAYDSLMKYDGRADIVVLGSGLAKSINARTGDCFTLLATTANGALNAIDVEFAGSFQASSPEYDKRALIVPLHTAQLLLNTNKVKNLVVALDETEKTGHLRDEIASRLKEKGFRVTVKKWSDLSMYYDRVRSFYHQMVGFLSLVLFIIVFFSTANTVMMAVVERTREIGTMLSLGTSRWQTLRIFFFEGLFIGIIGGALSAVFALALSRIINDAGIMLSPPPGLTFGYPLSIRNAIGFHIQTFIATVVVVTVASILPALKVTTMKIVDALGHI
ncbi:MAG: FtsX-like permease family protein [Candidatus Eisenbacteria bacterium]|nr:FtsX-like permease family protein [Candidatus Eisenbacteria bacterium]